MSGYGKKRGGKKTSPRVSSASGAGGARGPQPGHHGGPPTNTRELAPPGFAWGGIRHNWVILNILCLITNNIT